MKNNPDMIRAEAYAEIGKIVRATTSEILQKWSSAAREEQDSAQFAHRAELRDHLPPFIEHLGAELETGGNTREETRDSLARSHGKQRWEVGWRLDEVIRDYQLLRLVLMDHLDSSLDRDLTFDELKGVGLLLDDAIEDAVMTYVSYQDQHLTETEHLSLGTFENAAVGIGHVDPEGRWLRANGRLCKLLGCGLAELMRSEFAHAIHPDDFVSQSGRLEKLLEGEIDSFVAEMRMMRRDEHSFWANMTVSMQHSSQQVPLYYIVVVEDVSERRRLDAELKQAKIAAEEGNRLKSEFVANVSHEIRTPMNAILGLTELALDEPLTAELRDYLTTVHESGKSLLSLVNDLLDFSRMEAGKLELESTPFDLWQTIDETAKAVNISASEKGLELLTDVSSSVPRYAKGDPLRLRQIITNLVGNAVKFTNRGEVLIRAELESESETHTMIRFSVKDTGIGISEADKRRIFAPFTQADASTTRVFGGSGLGLAICTELISRLNGQLDVISQVGEGSEFFFRAEFEKAPTPVDVITRGKHRMDQVRGRRVLIVDDNSTNRAILQRILERCAAEVDLLDSGDAAIHKMRMALEANAPYDIIIVDALMPGRDGFSVIEEINQDGAFQATTVLMSSSADRSTFMERSKNLDIDGFLDKPVTRRDLLNVVSATNLGAETIAGAASTSVPMPASLDVLVVEDTPANQKVVRAVLRKRGHNVTLANNGREALEKLDVGNFHVILMDVQMPTMDGYQATAAIRELQDVFRANVPIIAMTAHAMKGDADKCLAAGMNDYISKPIDSRRLIDLVEEWGDKVTVNSGNNASPDTRSESDEAHPRLATEGTAGVADFETALTRLSGNQELLFELIEFFREDAPPLLDNLQSGIDGKDAKLVERSAHSIKGLAASFDAAQVTSVASTIENLARLKDLTTASQHVAALRASITRLDVALTEFAQANRRS